MAHVVIGGNCYEAWAAGARHILTKSGSQDHDLVLVVEDPQAWNPLWFSQVNPRAVSGSGENPSNVANTIFPLKTWGRSANRPALYSQYKRAHGKSRNKKWGTYFLRLINFGSKKVNQLERAINAISSWQVMPRNSICFHFSSPETDAIRLRGGPCLQAIQLHIVGDRVDFSAFYRNHDYFNKAFPNLIGLSRLQSFIAAETDLLPGGLVCYSTHAYSNSTKRELQSLLAR